jgi:hypothetical protein
MVVDDGAHCGGLLLERTCHIDREDPACGSQVAGQRVEQLEKERG